MPEPAEITASPISRRIKSIMFSLVLCSNHSVLLKCACFTGLEKLRPVKMAEEFDQLRDDTGPARLVTGSKTSAIVTVEIFVEQDVIFPLRICLKFFRTSVHRPAARSISQKDPG